MSPRSGPHRGVPYPTALTTSDLLSHIDRRCDRIEAKVDSLGDRVEQRLDQKAQRIGLVESRIGNLEGRDEAEDRKRARWGSRFWGLTVIAVAPVLSVAGVITANFLTGA